MKTLSLLLLSLLSVTSFISCKKDSVSKDPVAIEGVWKGTYSFGNGTADKFYSFVLKNSGVFEELNSSGVKIGEGTWEIDNNILTAEYAAMPPSTTEYSIMAAFKSSEGKLAGTWGYEPSVSDGGFIYLDKK